MHTTTFVWQHAAEPYDKDEESLIAALCVTFKLTLNEARLLVQLLLHDHRTADDLYAAVQTLTPGSARVLLSTMRKKLARYDIWVTAVYGLGYGLRTEDRAKIYKRLNKYDAGIAAAQLRTDQRMKHSRSAARVPP